MKRGTPGHWKILNLAMELKIEPYAAVGLCCCMWEWVGNSLMTGNIGKADDSMIARQIGWDKKPSILIDAMVKCGLLDRHPEHRLVVHDWSEHSDDGVHTWLVRRRLRFADGKAPRTRHLTSDERKEAEAYYAAATPPPHSKCGENVATPHQGHISNADGTDTDRNGSVRDGFPQKAPKGGDTSSAASGGEPAGKPVPKVSVVKPGVRMTGDERRAFIRRPTFSPGFEAFWEAYPPEGQRDKPAVMVVWLDQGLEGVWDAVVARAREYADWCKIKSVKPDKAGYWLRQGNYHDRKDLTQ